MAGRLLGAWNPALDSAANPISGSKLHTFSAGTTTPAVTYQDAALSTPNTNPVVADSAGRFVEMWAADAATFDVKWCDASDAQIKLFQSVQALGSTATGAVTRDFGADGKFNLESRGGTTYLESGDADPDSIGGKLRLGGWAGTQADSLVLDAALVSVTGVLSGIAQRGAIGGLTLSTAGSSGTFGIAAGQATDSTGATSLKLSAAITKTTGAWAAGTGNGALDTGTIANSTWYHVYLIANVTTGAVDVAVSTSAAAPTLPTGYTLYRRIGSMKTDGSAHWVAFSQIGDEFIWVTPVTDVSGGAIGATPNGITLASVPTGIKVQANLSVNATNASSAVGVNIADAAQSSMSSGAALFVFQTSGAGLGNGAQVRAWTNTAAAVLAVASAASTTLNVGTRGWLDRRGRDD